MKFYDREKELLLLKQINERAKSNSQFTVIVGRRRIGKTRLILKSLDNEIFLYFFVAKKNEQLLCEEFVQEIKSGLQIPIFGKFTKFIDLFNFILEASINKHFTLVIDEFQEFNAINPAIYSEMQNSWDRYKEKSHLNLIVSGSIYSLMTRIFEHSKEPLFGRANERIHLKPFDIETIKQILADHSPTYSAKDLLAFYIFTGGVPKYIELFIDKGAVTYSGLLDEIFRDNSYLLNEGRNILIEEFGKDYTTYFSILSLIASSKTSRAEIESILEKNTGGYLDKLENEYNIVQKIRPVLAKPTGRTVKYRIEDNFLNFWFRYIYKNRSAIEIQNFDFVRSIFERDFDTYSGLFLEKYFRQKLALQKEYAILGNYWEKNNVNEIDIVGINPVEKKALFAEVKLNKSKISITKLKQKSQKLAAQLADYTIEYQGFSLENL